jgi:hypothetical protein
VLKPHRLAFIALFLTALLIFAEGIFGGKQLGPTEHIQTMVSSSAVAPGYGWDVLQADGVLQFYPWRDLVFDAWRKGEVPLVNPYQLAGQPLNANSQSGGAYPLHILFAILPLSTVLKMNLLGMLHMFIAGIGMYFWIRKLTGDEKAGLVAGLLFASSQFLVSWSPLASVPTTIAWIPWILFGLHIQSARGLLLVALSTALMFLGGHLQFAAYGSIAIVIYAVSIAFQAKEHRTKALIPMLGIFLGALIAAPQVSLILKNSQTSHRKNVPSDEGYAAYLGGALQPFEALSLIEPKLLGSTTAKAESIAQSGSPTGYWPLFIKPNSNPAECALWILPAGVILAVFAFRKSAISLGASLITLVGLLLAFGTPLNKLLFFNVPGWSATGSPGRAIVLYVLGMCALAGIGYSYLSEKVDDKKTWKLLGLAPFLLVALGMNALRALPGQLKSGDEQFGKLVAILTQDAMLPMIAVAVASSLVILLLTEQYRKSSMLSWIGIAVLAMTGILNRPLMGKPLELPSTSTPPQERVVHESQSWNIALTPKATMPPNLSSLRREHDLYGYDSILDKDFVEKLKSVTGKDPAPPENGNMMLYRGEGDPNALKALGVGNRVEGGEITYDGYDHQIIQPASGSNSILIRDRFIEGTTVTPNLAKVQIENGFRRVILNGVTEKITLHYPGKSQIFLTLVLFTVVFVAFLGTMRNGKLPIKAN